MKKLLLSSMFSLLILTPAYAAAGACSGHDGVDCLAGHDSDGSVICNDGWTGSSVQYSTMVDVCVEDYQEIGPFIDIVQKNKYRTAILYLEENGVINGYSDGTFQADREINRAEFLKILVEGTGVTPDPLAYRNCFSDVFDEWFAAYVCYAKEQDWVSGYQDGSFKPSQTVIKAEAIKMLLNTQGVNVPETIEQAPYNDVALDDWFAPYVYQAKTMGILEETGLLFEPRGNMTRGMISENLYRVLIYSHETDVL